MATTKLPSVPARTPRLVSLETAAEFAGCSKWTIRRRVADGTITGYRTGPRLIRVDLNEVEARLLQVIPSAAGVA